MSVVANVAINVDSRDAVGKLRQVQSQSQQTERAIGNLGAAVGKLATAFGLIQAARFVFVKTAELESQTRSLQVLTGSAEKAGQIIQQLQQLGAVTPFTSTELIDSAKRLQAFGVETEKVVETTRRLADVSGATGAELQGLVTAYGQVQAKGRLQGEELLQFQERGVALQQELRKQYGLSGEEFQKALEKGRISAEAVEFAIRKLTDTGGKYANGAIAQSDTLSGKLSTLQDGIDALARRIGQVLTPALKAIFNQAIAVVDAINAALAAGRGGGFTRNVAGARQFLNIGATSQAVDNIAKGIGQVSSQKNKSGIQQNLQALQQYQRLLQSVGANDPNAGRAVQLQGQILTKINQNLAAQKQLRSGTQKTNELFTAPALLAPSGGGGKGRKGKSDAEREAERMARIQSQVQGLMRQTELTKQLTFLQEQIANAEAERDQQLVIRLQGEEKLLQLQYELADALASAETTSQREAAFANAQAKADQIRVGTALELSKDDEERAKRFEELLTGLDREIELNTLKEELAKKLKQIEFDIIDKRKEGIILTDEEAEAYRKRAQVLAKASDALTGQQKMQQELFEGLAGAFAGTVTSAFDAAVSGTENFGIALQDLGAKLLSTISQMLIMYSIAQALGALGGGAGNPQGILSFLARAFGYQGKANGGPVTGGAPYLVGERGPELFVPGTSGGVLSNNDLRQSMNGGGSPVLNMSFQTTRFGDTEYVSRDQLEAAMAETRRQASRDGAQRGMTMTLDRLQQSPRTRSRLGMR